MTSSTAPSDCRFCLSNRLLEDGPLFENGAFYVLGMRDPARCHAVMVVLKRHAETPFEITPQEWAALAEPLAFAQTHLGSFGPEGYTIGWNVGTVGGQHVLHVHLHVICRFAGEPATGLGLNGLLSRVNASDQEN